MLPRPIAVATPSQAPSVDGSLSLTPSLHPRCPGFIATGTAAPLWRLRGCLSSVVPTVTLLVVASALLLYCLHRLRPSLPTVCVPPPSQRPLPMQGGSARPPSMLGMVGFSCPVSSEGGSESWWMLARDPVEPVKESARRIPSAMNISFKCYLSVTPL